VTYRELQRLADIQAAIDAVRSHLLRGDLSDGLVFDAVRIRLLEIGEAVKALPELERAVHALAETPGRPGTGSPDWPAQPSGGARYARAFYAARGAPGGAPRNPAARRRPSPAQRQADGAEIRVEGPVETPRSPRKWLARAVPGSPNGIPGRLVGGGAADDRVREGLQRLQGLAELFGKGLGELELAPP
jgi:hypothetical protein